MRNRLILRHFPISPKIFKGFYEETPNLEALPLFLKTPKGFYEETPILEAFSPFS